MVKNHKKNVRCGKLFDRMAIAVIYVIFWAALMAVAVLPRIAGDVDIENGMGSGDIDKSGVPVMEIKLNGVTLDEVHENGKEVKYAGNVVFLDGAEFDDVEFKGRGNFSWMAEKKSYRIKFEHKVDLLGMGKAKKWALVANSVDDSLMRNDLAQYLMGMIVDGYKLNGEFVELIVDDKDIGLYYLIQVPTISKQMVDLRDPMGVLVEFDNVYCEEEEIWFKTVTGNCLTLKSAVADDNADMAMNKFIVDFNALEVAVVEGDYGAVEELADVKSLAEYFVISELTSNPDAYVTSWYFYKDGLDDKIHVGLAWDFDAAFGNRKWGDGGWPDEFYEPTTEMARTKYNVGMTGIDNLESSVKDTVKMSGMMIELMNMPEFRKLVGGVYREKLMNNGEEIMAYIDATAAKIREDAIHDAAKWEKGDFEAEVEYLKWWMRERMAFFEEKYVEYLLPLNDRGGAI